MLGKRLCKIFAYTKILPLFRQRYTIPYDQLSTLKVLQLGEAKVRQRGKTHILHNLLYKSAPNQSHDVFVALLLQVIHSPPTKFLGQAILPKRGENCNRKNVQEGCDSDVSLHHLSHSYHQPCCQPHGKYQKANQNVGAHILWEEFHMVGGKRG